MKKYIIEFTQDENGTVAINRTNDGFNFLEILGFIEISRLEVVEQIKGNAKVDVIKRQAIID